MLYLGRSIPMAYGCQYNIGFLFKQGEGQIRIPPFPAVSASQPLPVSPSVSGWFRLYCTSLIIYHIKAPLQESWKRSRPRIIQSRNAMATWRMLGNPPVTVSSGNVAQLLYSWPVCYDYCAEHNSGPHRIVDKLFSNTRYFVIKSNNFENVEIAKSKVRQRVVISSVLLVK